MLDIQNELCYTNSMLFVAFGVYDKIVWMLVKVDVLSFFP